MGADMYLNPPPDSRGPEDRVVVVMPTLEIYGPYRRGKANTVRTKLMTSNVRGPRQVKIRKLKRWTDE